LNSGNECACIIGAEQRRIGIAEPPEPARESTFVDGVEGEASKSTQG